jgi:exosome complex component RRP41
MELGVHSAADGSAIFELGLTKIWASCRGPRESSNNNTFGVTVEIVSAPFSTMERKKPRGDRYVKYT